MTKISEQNDSILSLLVCFQLSLMTVLPLDSVHFSYALNFRSMKSRDLKLFQNRFIFKGQFLFLFLCCCVSSAVSFFGRTVFLSPCPAAFSSRRSWIQLQSDFSRPLKADRKEQSLKRERKIHSLSGKRFDTEKEPEQPADHRQDSEDLKDRDAALQACTCPSGLFPFCLPVFSAC